MTISDYMTDQQVFEAIGNGRVSPEEFHNMMNGYKTKMGNDIPKETEKCQDSK